MDSPDAGRGTAPLGRLYEIPFDRSLRVTVMLGVAYVSGLAGLAVSLLGDAGGPTDPHTPVGVGLMGLSFVCLFVAASTIAGLNGGRPEERR